MYVAGLVMSLAGLIAIVSAFFGLTVARVVWADDAARADRTKSAYEEIHNTDQATIATMRRTIELLEGKN